MLIKEKQKLVDIAKESIDKINFNDIGMKDYDRLRYVNTVLNMLFDHEETDLDKLDYKATKMNTSRGKITKEQIDDIVKMYDSGEWSYGGISKVIGLSKKCVLDNYKKAKALEKIVQV